MDLLAESETRPVSDLLEPPEDRRRPSNSWPSMGAVSSWRASSSPRPAPQSSNVLQSSSRPARRRAPVCRRAPLPRRSSTPPRGRFRRRSGRPASGHRCTARRSRRRRAQRAPRSSGAPRRALRGSPLVPAAHRKASSREAAAAWRRKRPSRASRRKSRPGAAWRRSSVSRPGVASSAGRSGASRPLEPSFEPFYFGLIRIENESNSKLARQRPRCTARSCCSTDRLSRLIRIQNESNSKSARQRPRCTARLCCSCRM